MSREAVLKVAEQFRDHWHAQGGANARKVDWAAAWRNWVRREKAPAMSPARSQAAPSAPRPSWREQEEARATEEFKRMVGALAEAPAGAPALDDGNTIDMGDLP